MSFSLFAWLFAWLYIMHCKFAWNHGITCIRGLKNILSGRKVCLHLRWVWEALFLSKMVK